ncbi:MAG TPA: hypothetical protein VNV40_12930, partial [Steroidobacteraceae bacterium]|nr:hypothetical protein [Steroidobacteraceae bacterium]
IGLPQELQTPGYQSIQFIVHGLLLGWERSQNVTLDLGLHKTLALAVRLTQHRLLPFAYPRASKAAA